MSQSPLSDPDAYVRLMAEAMGLPLDAANPAEVARNLSLAFRLAEQFMDVPLGDEAEFAAVFSAREQADG